ncbi:MAG: sensor histidine kinase [Opitutia bacterium]|jgi:two-component system, sporulation sensor kinase E
MNPRRRSDRFDRLLGRVEDLDPRNLAILARRIDRERHLMETVLETLREGVLVLTEDNRVAYANPAALTLAGLPPEAATAAEPARFSPELATALEGDIGGAARSREIEVAYPEPRILRVHLAAVEGPSAGAPLRVAVLADISAERVQAEDRVESERIDSIMTLAAGVAHEIGNPLNAMGIHLELLRRRLGGLGKDASKALESVDVLEAEVRRLDGIVRNFLGAVRPVRPDLAETQLLEVVAASLALLKDQLEQLGVRATVDVSGELPTVLADRGQVQQALFNVLKNALEAMDRGGDLTIRARSEDDWVVLEVSDTGVGIPAEKLTRVFDAYYTTKSDGSGLGLLIVLRILRAHGGRVDLASQPGKGTTVTLRFPQRHRRVRLLS